MKVVFPWPPKDLSPNARLHWTKLAKAKKQYRQACHILAKQAGAAVLATAEKVHIELTFYPPDRRLRDEDNIFASMKAGLDGLADAMGVNDRKFKTSFQVADEIGGFVRVEVRTPDSTEGSSHGHQDRSGQ